MLIDGTLSNMVSVTSGPQRSILGQLLIYIYISYITSSTIAIFADDTKCGKAIKSPKIDNSLLQSDGQLHTLLEPTVLTVSKTQRQAVLDSDKIPLNVMFSGTILIIYQLM